MLKGQAKTNYQREYMRRYRMGLTGSNAVGLTGSNQGSNQSLASRLKKTGLNVDGNRICLAPQSKSSPLKKEINTRIPLYNRFHSQAGDQVRMPDGSIVLVPERDEEGNPF